MKKELLSAEIYPSIHKVIVNISGKAGLRNLNVYIYPSDLYTGEAKKDGVYLTTALVKDFYLHPHLLKFFFSHELIHFKNKEFLNLKKAFSVIIKLITSKIIPKPYLKLNALRLLREMRANIEGAALAGLNNNEILSAQELAQKKNNSSIRPKSYEVGYPDREMIKDFCIRYKKLDESVAEEVLQDYCEKLNISNEKDFIDKAIIAFFH